MPKRARRARSESVVPKAALAKEVARVLEERQMTQTEASYLIRGTPSEISLMVNGRTQLFSSERLLRTLVCLGRDVDIVLRKSKGPSGKVRIVSK